MAQTVAAVARGLCSLEDLRGFGLGVGQVADRGQDFALLAWLRIERNVLPGQPRLHLEHLFGLDAEILRDARSFLARQRARPGLHAAQVEEQLPLRLGGRDLDQAPVAQNVFVDLGTNPVQGKRHQAHAPLGVETAHRLHQPDIAFLNKIGLRQTIS